MSVWNQVFPKAVITDLTNTNNCTVHSCTCYLKKTNTAFSALLSLCYFFHHAFFSDLMDGRFILNDKLSVGSQRLRTVLGQNCKQTRVRSHGFFNLTHLFRSFVLQIQAGIHNWRSPTGSHRFLHSDTGCCCRSVFWQSILGGQENKRVIYPFDLSRLIRPTSLFHQHSKESEGNKLFIAGTMIISHWLYFPAVLITVIVIFFPLLPHLAGPTIKHCLTVKQSQV